LSLHQLHRVSPANEFLSRSGLDVLTKTKGNARSNTGSEASSSQSSGPYISEEDLSNLDIEEEQYVPAVELEDVMEDSPMLRERLHLLGQVSRSRYSKKAV